MSEIPQALIDAAVREIQSVENETGERLDRDDVVRVVLGLFEIRDEFRADALPGYTFPNGPTLAREIDARHIDGSAMSHRYVASTDWRDVEARVEWEIR